MRVEEKIFKFSQCFNNHTLRVVPCYQKPIFYLDLLGWVGPVSVFIGQFKIQDNGSHVHALQQILIFSQSLRGGKRRSQKFHLPFKIGFDTQLANKVLIKSFLKEGLDPRFRPSLRDFTNNSTSLALNTLTMCLELDTLNN